jgi:hypothetical protein
MTKRKRKRRTKPATPKPEPKPETELSGLERVLRPRKSVGGKVALEAYAYRSVAA